MNFRRFRRSFRRSVRNDGPFGGSGGEARGRGESGVLEERRFVLELSWVWRLEASEEEPG